MSASANGSPRPSIGALNLGMIPAGHSLPAAALPSTFHASLTGFKIPIGSSQVCSLKNGTSVESMPRIWKQGAEGPACLRGSRRQDAPSVDHTGLPHVCREVSQITTISWGVCDAGPISRSSKTHKKKTTDMIVEQAWRLAFIK